MDVAEGRCVLVVLGEVDDALPHEVVRRDEEGEDHGGRDVLGCGPVMPNLGQNFSFNNCSESNFALRN